LSAVFALKRATEERFDAAFLRGAFLDAFLLARGAEGVDFDIRAGEGDGTTSPMVVEDD
jgi:hypothetical protein